MAQLSLAWCFLNQAMHTVILGTSSMQQLKENLASLDLVDHLLSDATLISAIEDCVANKPPLPFRPTYAQVLAHS
jgi:aryl-alcohol dehydrogenase-like predicted oxidoreductase